MSIMGGLPIDEAKRPGDFEQVKDSLPEAPPTPQFSIAYDREVDPTVMVITVPLEKVARDENNQHYIFMRGFLDDVKDLAMRQIKMKRAYWEQNRTKILSPGGVPLKAV